MSRLTIQEAIELIKQVPLYRYECELEKHRQSDLFQALNLSIEAMQELQHYKDLEEQGRLIITKYTKGQTVYEVDDETDEICEYEVASNDVWHDVTSDYCDPWNRLDSFREDSPLVFATKEEAEAKLKKLKGE